ncbi:aminotransferase class I/II-fold pyridoxal phosphate-dependent enzyme [Streptomyces sp. SID12501]|uniref:Aminotransferase class I/II-fold pyridoxal phosphate-dependent enzyme n=1 Tax=Streptomyces sp. SID12501 TaxID=2706042 RepID=A0A6B3BPB3_9ACTN|nr:aminotransferase class I/II-fold pyridoxal phosphate-dependent enzyme [Streptomyces sp. SID12501]NEC86173.1 aminotransferase class I/II-fold pyridoxal phosphate-dependent enzyme [Streptomyces sp. SID12501]
MKAPVRLPNLTQYEHLAVDCEFNLADGHAHQLQDSAQQLIIRRLPSLFSESERYPQRNLEQEFQRRFYELAGQPTAADRPHTLLCQSASMSIDLVAAFLSDRGTPVGLLQPCFDNLPGILRRRGAVLCPVAERELAGPGLERLFGPRGPAALFLTLPNNPTGFALREPEFTHLAQRCAATGTVLVIDWTFRFYGAYERWDQYAVLERSGVSYLCVEDTGKTWPTLDLKCSILATSRDLYEPLCELHNDMMLNVSPFVLHLLTRYLEDSVRRGLEATVRRLVRDNRAVLRRTLEGTVLTPAEPDPTISVEWACIDSPALTALDVVRLLGDVGVGILPGDHFYWDDPATGSRYVRFALARDPAMFAAACARMRAVLIIGSLQQRTGAA